MPNEVDSTPGQAVTEGSPAPSPESTADRHKVRGARGRFVSTGGPRRRGGQPGNLNSPGASVTPWRTLLRRGRVRPEFAWVVPQVERKVREYTEHMGGRDEVSDAEATLVHRAALLHAAVLLLTGLCMPSDFAGWPLARPEIVFASIFRAFSLLFVSN
jgi:hypothetical protein